MSRKRRRHSKPEHSPARKLGVNLSPPGSGAWRQPDGDAASKLARAPGKQRKGDGRSHGTDASSPFTPAPVRPCDVPVPRLLRHWGARDDHGAGLVVSVAGRPHPTDRAAAVTTAAAAAGSGAHDREHDPPAIVGKPAGAPHRRDDAGRGGQPADGRPLGLAKPQPKLAAGRGRGGPNELDLQALGSLRAIEDKYLPRTDYMSKQPHISFAMRFILVDWLAEVQEVYRLTLQTLFIAVSYIDRFLSRMTVQSGKLQLLGVAALMLACKYEEIWPPSICMYAYITANTYSQSEILKMEHVILETLAFDMGSITQLSFHAIFTVGSTSSVRVLSLYLMELTLLDGGHFLSYRPSVISAAAVCTARHIMQHRPWPAELAALHAGVDLVQLQACVADVHRLLIEIATIPHLIVRGKYATSTLFDVNALPIPAEPPMVMDTTSARAIAASARVSSKAGPSSLFPASTSPATVKGRPTACAGRKIMSSPPASPVPTKALTPPSPRGKGNGAKKPETAVKHLAGGMPTCMQAGLSAHKAGLKIVSPARNDRRGSDGGHTAASAIERLRWW